MQGCCRPWQHLERLALHNAEGVGNQRMWRSSRGKCNQGRPQSKQGYRVCRTSKEHPRSTDRTLWDWTKPRGGLNLITGLACCDSWGRKESGMTERLNWTELNRCSCKSDLKFTPGPMHAKRPHASCLTGSRPPGSMSFWLWKVFPLELWFEMPREWMWLLQPPVIVAQPLSPRMWRPV